MKKKGVGILFIFLLLFLIVIIINVLNVNASASNPIASPTVNPTTTPTQSQTPTTTITCSIDSDCPQEYYCSIGKCKLPTITDCIGNIDIEDQSFICECKYDLDCPAGYVCLFVRGGKRCVNPSKCKNEYECPQGHQFCIKGVCVECDKMGTGLINCIAGSGCNAQYKCEPNIPCKRDYQCSGVCVNGHCSKPTTCDPKNGNNDCKKPRPFCVTTKDSQLKPITVCAECRRDTVEHQKLDCPNSGICGFANKCDPSVDEIINGTATLNPGFVWIFIAVIVIVIILVIYSLVKSKKVKGKKKKLKKH